MQYAALQNQFLKKSNVYYGFALVVALVGGLYLFQQFREYSVRAAAIEQNGQQIQVVQKRTAERQQEYEALSAAFKTEQGKFNAKILSVLPEGEQYTKLTRDLDVFFDENFTTRNKFIASSLRFGEGIVSSAGGHYMLPFSLSIESSKENFFKFLQFIEESGSLSDGTRLMDMESIRITLPEDSTSGDFIYTVNLNAYYRN